MRVDPVCGMQVDEGEAKYVLAHDGQTYYFCSEGCRAEFERHTEDYAGASSEGGEQDVPVSLLPRS